MKEEIIIEQTRLKFSLQKTHPESFSVKSKDNEKELHLTKRFTTHEPVQDALY